MTDALKLTIGSRGSALALWQSNWVKARLEALGYECEIRIIKTTGDRIQDVPLAKVGSKGLFTKEIEDALLAGEVDLAVHSLKDMPTELPAGLAITGVPERENPLDALVGRKLDEMPVGSKVGTSSLRRAAQLKALRPDLRIENIRGNVDTRLRKLDEGQYDAIVLASAGLRRLGWGERIAEMLPVEVMCPAVGQGALAIETRDDEGPGATAVRRLDHAATRAAVTAERALLAQLGGGCQVPIGAHATLDDTGTLALRALVISPDGSLVVKGTQSGSAVQAAEIGARLGRRLLDEGARSILRTVYGTPLQGCHVVITRAQGQAGDLASLLAARGAEVIDLPTIAIEAPEDFSALDAAIAALGSYHWLIFTSVNGVRFFFERLQAAGLDASEVKARVCAIGPATQDAAQSAGLKVDRVPAEYVAESLVESFAQDELAGCRILLPRAAVARDVVPVELGKRGARVDVVEAYRTVTPADAGARVAEIFAGDRRPEWITFTSSSTVKNFMAIAGGPAVLDGVKVASIGPVTSATAREFGLTVAIEAGEHTMAGLVDAICEANGPSETKA